MTTSQGDPLHRGLHCQKLCRDELFTAGLCGASNFPDSQPHETAMKEYSNIDGVQLRGGLMDAAIHRTVDCGLLL